MTAAVVPRSEPSIAKAPAIDPRTMQAMRAMIVDALRVAPAEGESPNQWIEGRASSLTMQILHEFAGPGATPIRILDDITEPMAVSRTTFDAPAHPLGCACSVCV